MLAGVTSPPLAPQGTGVTPSTPSRSAASPAIASATLQSPSHLEQEDFSALAAAHPDIAGELMTAASKLTQLKAEVTAWQKQANGIDDAHARPRREKVFLELLKR